MCLGGACGLEATAQEEDGWRDPVDVPAEAVRIAGVWIVSNTGNPKGCEFLRFWDAEDEALPTGMQQAARASFVESSFVLKT